MKTEFIEELKKLTKKAFSSNEVPVGCIIVKNNRIVSKAYNKKESSNNPLHHAEIIAIIKACKKLKTWKLDDCEMYVTLEPCDMCKEVIKEARIKTVLYILESKTIKKTMTKYEKCDMEKLFFENLIKSFFKQKR